MWRIIRAEVSYHKYVFLFFLALMPALIVHEMHGPAERIPPAILIWMLVFLPVNTWVSVRAKDKRELQYMQLPVAAWEIGAARISIVLASGLASAALYAVLHLALVPAAPFHIKAFLASTLGVLLLYSLVFIVSDRVVGSRALSDAKTWIVILLCFMVLGNLYLLIATRRLRRSGGPPPFFIRALEYLFEHHPFSTDLRTTVTICVVIALALLSILSFTRRKTQIA
jgi:hypothetical protein